MQVTPSFSSLRGEVIRNNKTGDETKFRRENNVYRMTVKLHEEGFARQGSAGMEDESLKYFGNLGDRV